MRSFTEMNSRSAVRHFRLPAFLLAAAIVVVAGWLIFSKVFLSDALIMPLGMEDGRWTSPPFRVHARNDYRAAVEIERTFSFHETECLLDVGMPYPNSSASGPPENCPAAFKAPAIGWEILENGRQLRCAEVFPLNTGGYAAASMDHEFCELSLRPNAEYVARVSVSGAPLVWRQTSPRFRVLLEPMVIETGAVLSFFVFVTTMLLVMAALVIAFLGWLGARKASHIS